jgi:hypothetical protein
MRSRACCSGFWFADAIATSDFQQENIVPASLHRDRPSHTALPQSASKLEKQALFFGSLNG